MLQSRVLIAVLILAVLGYGGFKLWPLVSGPIFTDMRVETNPEGLTVLSGSALHTESLTLNGRTLLINEDGSFSKEITFPRGGVILTLSATDRFGRSRSQERTVVIP